jgi:hypothetical protein
MLKTKPFERHPVFLLLDVNSLKLIEPLLKYLSGPYVLVVHKF